MEIIGRTSKRIEWTLQEFYMEHRNGRRLIQKLTNAVRNQSNSSVSSYDTGGVPAFCTRAPTLYLGLKTIVRESEQTAASRTHRNKNQQMQHRVNAGKIVVQPLSEEWLHK